MSFILKKMVKWYLWFTVFRGITNLFCPKPNRQALASKTAGCQQEQSMFLFTVVNYLQMENQKEEEKRGWMTYNKVLGWLASQTRISSDITSNG